MKGRVVRYFDLGKMVEGLFPLEYQEENPVYKIPYSGTNDVHCLDSVFMNSAILYDYFFIRCASESGIGAPFGKNAQWRTHLHWVPKGDRNSGTLRIIGNKTYSRRSERLENHRGVKRTYVSEIIAKRVEWFLTNSPFVKSFKRTINREVVFSYDIEFISGTSEKQNLIDDINQLKFKLTSAQHIKTAWERKISDFQSLKSLHDNLNAACDNINSIEHQIKLLEEKL